MADLKTQALDDFFQRVLSPSIEACSDLRSGEHYTEVSLRLAVLESLLWLDAGVNLNVFDPVVAHRLLLYLQPIIRKQYSLIPVGVKQTLPQLPLMHLQNLVDKTNFTEWFHFKESRGLAVRLEIITGLLGRFNSVLAISSTVAALLLLRTSTWDAFVRQPFTSADMAAALDGTEDPWILGYSSLAKAGCLSLIEHLDAVLNAVRYDDIPTDTEPEQWAEFRKLIYLISSCRLHFDNGIFGDRFETLTGIVGRIVSRELEDFGVTNDAAGWNHFASGVVRGWRGLFSPTGETAFSD
ncbi:MAG: hypothetical protein ABSG03_37390 [Bryobacteraceae bacterium]|jgi:hypothetical protein